MAWICMTAAIGYPILVLFTDSRQLGDIATPFYMFVSAVVGAYVGFASWEDVKMKQNRDWRDYDDRSEDNRNSRHR